MGVDDPAAEVRRARVRKDMRWSALWGPLQVSIPILAYAVLYPLIISTAGLATLGAWGLLMTTSSAMSLLDVGFSASIAREAGECGRVDDPGVLARVASAVLLYLGGAGLLLVAWLLAGDVVLHVLGRDGVDAGRMRYVVAGVICGGFFVLLGQLYGALLVAQHKTYVVQAVAGLVPLVRYVIAGVGVVAGVPLEGLSVGVLVAAVSQFVVVRVLVGRVWGERLGLLSVVKVSGDLLREGFGLYVVNIVLLLRQVLVRGVLASVGGLEVVAVFELAERVPGALRALGVAGARALFSAYVGLKGEVRERLTGRALVVLFSIVGSGLGGFAVVADLALALWVGGVGSAGVLAARVFSVSYWVGLVGIPFWYRLMADRKEVVCAKVVSVHCVAAVLLLALVPVFEWDISGVVVYWCAVGLGVEVLLLVVAERTGGGVAKSLAVPAVRSGLLRGAACVAGAGAARWWAQQNGYSGVESLVLVGVVGVLGVAVLVAPFVLRNGATVVAPKRFV